MAYIKMKPVFDCGYVFDELSICRRVEASPTDYDSSLLTIPRPNIYPALCPKCGTEISGVIMLNCFAVAGYDFFYKE